MKKSLAVPALLAASALALTACSGSGGNEGGGGGGGDSILIGTTETVTSLDPAAAYDNGSNAVIMNVYPQLMNNPIGDAEVEPDIAESAEFTSPTEYTVILKEGLTFANGNELTSSDVKHSFDRMINIADPNGPSSLLAAMDGVEAPDDTTVVFTLNAPDDQTFPATLSSMAGFIVDEEVFPADEILDDATIVEEQPFAGQYALSNFDQGNLASFTANEDYQGVLGPAENETVNMQYFANEANLSQAIETKNVDIAYRSLSATDVEKFEGTDDLNVVKGPGGEIRYLVFNFNTQPFGASTDDADADKALAVRQAVADSLDREAISSEVFKDTYTPLYSFIPEGLMGGDSQVMLEKYGDGAGGPDLDRAAQRLEDAGVETPVNLQLQYAGERYGAASAEEYAQIKSQLEADGLFSVDLQSTEWGQYNEDRVSDLYPVHQLGWFPDFSDADTFLTPFFIPDNFLVNHFEDDEVTDLINEQRTTGDTDEREAIVLELQELLGEHLSTLPMLQGEQVAVTVDGVEGVTLDASFKLRFGPLTK